MIGHKVKSMKIVILVFIIYSSSLFSQSRSKDIHKLLTEIKVQDELFSDSNCALQISNYLISVNSYLDSSNIELLLKKCNFNYNNLDTIVFSLALEGSNRFPSILVIYINTVDVNGEKEAKQFYINGRDKLKSRKVKFEVFPNYKFDRNYAYKCPCINRGSNPVIRYYIIRNERENIIAEIFYLL